MPKLLVQFPGDTEPRVFDLEGGEITIGKHAEKNVVVIPDNRVSREHARVDREGDGYFLEDRGSKNGTTVNGKIAAPFEPRRLADGAVIALADACTIIFQEAAEPSTERVKFADRPLGEQIIIKAPEEVAEELPPVDMEAMATAPPQSLMGEVIRLQAQLERQGRRLKLLYELGKSLSSVFSLGEIFLHATDVLFGVTPADRCCVLLKDEKSGELCPATVRSKGRPGDAPGQTLFVSETIVRRVVQDRVSVASFYTQSDDEFKGIESIITKGIQSVMCAPLIGRGGILGVIYADRQDPIQTFSEDDLELLNAIAGETSTAVDNALSYERLSREALARAAYGRFLPKHVVEAILESPDSLKPGGSNLLVTILFADIRGFTPIAERARPEQVVLLLNTYFEAMTEIIFKFGGTLDKYLGDGLMALFGAPYSKADDAARAVDAAIAMQERLPSLCEELKEHRLPEIGIGIGIDTGEVTVGYIGAERRLDYTVIGDAVNLAARLQAQAERGDICISEKTKFALAGAGRHRFEALGPLEIRGRKERVKVYKVRWGR